MRSKKKTVRITVGRSLLSSISLSRVQLIGQFALERDSGQFIVVVHLYGKLFLLLAQRIRVDRGWFSPKLQFDSVKAHHGAYLLDRTGEIFAVISGLLRLTALLFVRISCLTCWKVVYVRFLSPHRAFSFSEDDELLHRLAIIGKSYVLIFTIVVS